MKQYLTLGLSVLLIALLMVQSVLAVEFNQTISAADKAKFDQILQPVQKVYNLIKYTVSVIAVVILLFAGITYMISGSDPGKREKAKNMAMYVIIGLLVIWAAPLIVSFITG